MNSQRVVRRLILFIFVDFLFCCLVSKSCKSNASDGWDFVIWLLVLLFLWMFLCGGFPSDWITIESSFTLVLLLLLLMLHVYAEVDLNPSVWFWFFMFSEQENTLNTFCILSRREVACLARIYGSFVFGKGWISSWIMDIVVFCVGFETDIYGSFVERAKRGLGSLTQWCKTLEPKSELLFL